MYASRRCFRCIVSDLPRGSLPLLFLLLLSPQACEVDPASADAGSWAADAMASESAGDAVPAEASASELPGSHEGEAGAVGDEVLEGSDSVDALLEGPCPTPRGPALSITHASARLRFHVASDAPVQTGWALGATALEPEAWVDDPELALPATALPQIVTLFARVVDPSCGPEHWFVHVTELREAYPPAAGSPGTTAIPADSAAIAGWASSYLSPVAWGSDLVDAWRSPEDALGPAQGDPGAVCSLGNGGALSLGFDLEIRDEEGPDLAVFENGLSDSFLELAWVEVSSDGVHWLRFDSAYLGDEPVPAFGGHDATLIGGLAGAYRVGFGVPFDLATLRNRAAVRQGLVDLQGITAVRLVDVLGDGSALDSFGAPIYDPYKTVESAGFDLDGVAVLRAPQ